MVRLAVLFLLSTFAWSSTGFAGESVKKTATSGDVCDIRPDLCGGAPKSKKVAKKKKKPCRHRNDERDEVIHLPICGSQAAEVAGDIEDELMMEESAAEMAATGKRTRKNKVQAQDSSEATAAHKAMLHPQEQRQQVESNLDPHVQDAPSFEPQQRVRPMNYNDYINKNANHPALTARRLRHDQTAFVETKRAYILPAASGTPGAAGAAGSAAGSGVAGAPGAGGATTTLPGANPATGTASGIPAAGGIGAAPGIAPPAGIAPVHSGTAGGDPNQTNNYGSDGNQPPPGSSGGN